MEGGIGGGAGSSGHRLPETGQTDARHDFYRFKMKRQTIDTINITAHTPTASGQLGLFTRAPRAKNADSPAVHAAAVTCFVRSSSLNLLRSLVESVLVSSIFCSHDTRQILEARWNGPPQFDEAYATKNPADTN
jgi:hypothetical protein